MTLVQRTKEQRTVVGNQGLMAGANTESERVRRGEAREEEQGWEHRGEFCGAELIKKTSPVWLAAENHFYIWVLLEALQISVVCSSSSL